MKICSKCHIEKDASEYYKCKYNLDGLSSYCKECAKKASNIRYEKYKEYYDEHVNDPVKKEKRNIYQKLYKLKPEVKKKIREYNKKIEVKKKIRDYYKNYDWTKYYNKRKLLRMQYPEKILAHTASANIISPPDTEKHHWSYNVEHRKDVIFLSLSTHRIIHRNMIYDQERMMFRKLDGILLDSKLSHMEYIDYIEQTS